MWQDVIWQLIEQNAERAGVMVHLATPELDGGPVVTYCTYPIRGPEFGPLWHDVETNLWIEPVKAREPMHAGRIQRPTKIE